MNEYLITMVNRPDGPFKIKAEAVTTEPFGCAFWTGTDISFFITYASLICWCLAPKSA